MPPPPPLAWMCLFLGRMWLVFSVVTSSVLFGLVAGGGRVQIISHGKIYASNFHFFWAGVEVDLRSCGNWRVFLLNKVISFASLSSQATFMG